MTQYLILSTPSNLWPLPSEGRSGGFVHAISRVCSCFRHVSKWSKQPNLLRVTETPRKHPKRPLHFGLYAVNLAHQNLNLVSIVIIQQLSQKVSQDRA